MNKVAVCHKYSKVPFSLMWTAYLILCNTQYVTNNNMTITLTHTLFSRMRDKILKEVKIITRPAMLKAAAMQKES